MSVKNCLDLPMLGYGMGLRPCHYDHVLEHKPDIDWFEIISENYMDTQGRPKHVLEQIKEHYPIVMHGVSLSIGTIDPLNSDYLKQLKDLADWVQPKWISDHLCWTGVAHKNTHDLLPVPYTEDALKHIVDRIKQVQDYLERPILIENPSTYLEFNHSDMTEWDFINEMAKQSNCGLLLDVNNIYVSCYNHKWDPKTYIDALPLDRVVQVHLAGHQNNGTHIIDTHDGHVVDEVWSLYKYLISKTGDVSTMVEWDADIPEFDVVKAEVDKAKNYAKNVKSPNNLPQFEPNDTPYDVPEKPLKLSPQLHHMQDAILSGQGADFTPEKWIKPKKELSEQQQIDIYIDGYRYRLFDLMYDDFSALRHYWGDEKMTEIINEYIEKTPSESPNVAHYLRKFPDFIKQYGDDFAYELTVLEERIETLFDADENTALTTEHLSTMAEETVMNSPMPLRKALSLHKFDYLTNAYYGDLLADKKPTKADKKPSYVAVYRHEYAMWRLDLEEIEYNILCQLQDNVSINDALMTAISNNPNTDIEALTADIQKWFTRWINNGVLAYVD